MKWYKYDIRDLCETEYTKWYSLMREDKRRRVDRFRFVEDKKRTVTGEMLARKAIAEWCKVAPESIRFSIGENGKPYVEDLDIEFNISHSGDMVVCAVDDKSVGIDIEQVRPIDLTVAKHFCSEEELLNLFGYTPAEKDFSYTANEALLIRFFKIWTEKEAYGKYLGCGLMQNGQQIPKAFKKILVVDNYCICIITAV